VIVRDDEGDLVDARVQALTLRIGRWSDEPVVYVGG
jgi:hypothetical protein